MAQYVFSDCSIKMKLTQMPNIKKNTSKNVLCVSYYNGNQHYKFQISLNVCHLSFYYCFHLLISVEFIFAQYQ